MYYNRCLRIRRNDTESGNAIQIAEVLNCIGTAHFEMKNYLSAKKFHMEAMHLKKQSLDESHPDVAFCWYSLGQIYREEEKLNEALSCFQSSLNAIRHCLPRDHIDIGNTLYNIGFCLLGLNEYGRAVISLSEALRIMNLNFDTNYMKVAETSHCLGRAQLMEGLNDDALQSFNKAIHIKMKYINDQKINNMKELEDMKNCIDSSLMIVKHKLGTNCPEYASLLQKRGICLGLLGKFRKATKAYRKAIAISTKIFGPNHMNTANLYFNLGICVNEKGDPDEGVKYLLKSLKITSQNMGDEHHDLVDVYFQIGRAYQANNHVPDATKNYESALHILKANSSYDTLKASLIIHHIGDIVSNLNFTLFI